ncbi:MAG: DUF4149 domain-containing protein [Desulfuromonadaceae bacterium]
MHFFTLIYRLAVALWVGGAVLFTFILTPTLFQQLNRDEAGTIVGLLFPGYFRYGLICGALALVCLLLSRKSHPIASALIIATMLIITLVQAFVIEPKAAAIKKEIPSFVTTSPEDPKRQEFKKLHAVSAVSNLSVIGGGIALVILF